MKSALKKKLRKKSDLTQSMREAVFRHYGHRCYYPSCKLPITDTNPLCVHDITHTGQHKKISLQRPVCFTHHNQATADARSAKVKADRFRARGIQISTKQTIMFEELFYGPAKGN